MSNYKVPHTFIAGTRAKASQVNTNFDYVTDVLKDLDETKAENVGNAAYNFSVAEPIKLQHAATKRYVDLAVANSGGGGSGVGKSMFEVFHTLSTKTPSGAFSLRSGEVILDAMNTYPAFWEALLEQGAGLIPDFTNVTAESMPEGYTATFTNVAASDKTYEARAFSPYSWFTTSTVPSSSSPIVAELELKELITCPYFRLNSHVIDTYNSTGEANAGKAIKVASISVRQQDGTWVPVSIINESEAPTTNERYFKSSNPDLKFNAMRIVIAENFGAAETDISLYPFDPEFTSVRVVPEEQWQWEVETYHETGAFVLSPEEQTIRLPKITRMLSGISELWQVGLPEANEVSKSGLRWQEGSAQSEIDLNDSSAISLDTVHTGLWIQVYNAVAEDALSNIRYIPHAVLFEERPFRFVPDQETGWAVSDGNWKDGHYYTAAMTELLNEYASAITPAGKNYKLSPKGKRFVEDSVYVSTYKSYGEAPYYVVDPKNYRFKTPISDNYIRYTHTIDNTNELLLDAAPNIIGWFPGTEAELLKPGTEGLGDNGAFYQKAANVTSGSSDNNTFDNDIFGFDASRSNSVYGRDGEIRPKSAYYLMCVFLGNEVPQSTTVDVLYKIKEQDKRISALEDTQSVSAEGLKKEVDELKEATSVQAEKINENASSLIIANTKIENNSEQIISVQADVSSLQDKDVLIDSALSVLSNKVSTVEASTQNALNQAAEALNSAEGNANSIEVLNERVTSATSSIETLKTDKADKTYVDGKLELKANSSDVASIQTALNGLKFWTGTQTEYEAIANKDVSTLYIVTGE